MKRARNEIRKYDAEAIYNQVKNLIGKSVKVEVVISSGKSRTEEGVITKVYPKLFLIEKNDNGINYKYSHTFVDIFTNRINIEVLND